MDAVWREADGAYPALVYIYSCCRFSRTDIQKVNRPSLEPVAMTRPSGEKQTELIEPWRLYFSDISSRFLMSQRRTEPSSEPDATMCPSGEKQTEFTPACCYPYVSIVTVYVVIRSMRRLVHRLVHTSSSQVSHRQIAFCS